MSALGLYAAQERGLSRLNPLTALAWSIFCLVAGLSLQGTWTPYVVFALAVVPAAAWSGVLRPLLANALRITLPFAISVFLIQGLFWTNGTPVVSLGPLSLKSEGLQFAAQSTGRILVVVGSFLLLSLSTRADRLMLALQARGVPDALTYIVVTTLQIAPRLIAKANTILDAQRARGLETEGSFGRRLRALLPLAGPLVLGSIVDIEERAIALEARGFSHEGRKTSLLVLTDTGRQRAGRWLLLAGMVAAIVAGATARYWWRH